MLRPKMLYSLDEVVLTPAAISNISSRSECNFRDTQGNLPLFIAPMSCLVNESNYSTFDSKGFNVILPRTVSLEKRLSGCIAGAWVAFGLDEAENFIKDYSTFELQNGCRICVDIANGHQRRAFELCRKMRKHLPNVELMVGNIANPWAYLQYAIAGADYIRLGIGSGHVCTTSVQTGIHYPIASLIAHCTRIKKVLRFFNFRQPKLVADGGFGYIDQIVKAIALGADYVMLGRIAAGFPEACGEIVDGAREYYGMSTEKAQKLMHPEPGYVPKHTEGTVRYIPILESTDKWINDFTHALKSSMSYCNAKNLKEYSGRVKWGLQSPVTFKAYIKS